LALGDALVVGVGDLDVLVEAGDDDGLVAVDVVFLVAPGTVVLPTPDDEVLATVRLEPEDERPVDGELEPEEIMFRLLATESEADFAEGD